MNGSVCSMKLDRNVTPDGRGKYALINLRKRKHFKDYNGRISVDPEAITWGGDDQFFVLKYKDQFAAAALRAYAQAVRIHYKLLQTGNDAESIATKKQIDSLKEYADEIEHEAGVAASWPNRRIPD